MSKKASLKHIFTEERYTGRITKVESKVLATLIKMRKGNAYAIWKMSGLKHYPTVLRALKNLKRKGYVLTEAKVGVRNKTIYSPTFGGTIVLELLQRNYAKLAEIIAHKSSKFREIMNVGVQARFIAINMARKIVQMARTEGEEVYERGLDRILRSALFDAFVDDIYNISDANVEEILKVKKINWAKDVVLNLIHEVQSSFERDLISLNKLEQKLKKEEIN